MMKYILIHEAYIIIIIIIIVLLKQGEKKEKVKEKEKKMQSTQHLRLIIKTTLVLVSAFRQLESSYFRSHKEAILKIKIR